MTKNTFLKEDINWIEKEGKIEKKLEVSKMRITNLIKEQVNLQSQLEALSKQRYNLIKFLHVMGLEKEFWEWQLKSAPKGGGK